METLNLSTLKLNGKTYAVEGADTDAIYDEGYAAGQQAEYDRFWDNAQTNGNRVNYTGAFFGVLWNNETFCPKYDIRPDNAYNIFARCEITDLVSTLDKAGVVLDFSQTTNFDGMFTWSSVRNVGIIDTRGAASISNMCSYGYNLTKIQKLILKDDGSQSAGNAFTSCSNLTTLTIEGTIGQNGFDLHWSPLDKASIQSVINALSATTTGLTVTLSQTAVNKAFETSSGANDGSASAEWATLTGTKTNWTINLS